MSVLQLGEWDTSKRMALISVLYLSKLNYSLIILHPGLLWCSPTPERARAFCCLISLLCCIFIVKVHYSFFRIQWESLLPHPQVLKILKLALEKYKCTKRQAKQALCSALNHFLSQVQPLCVILPWLIEWDCADWGSWGDSDGVLSFGLHFILPVGKRKFFAGIGCLGSFKF